MLILCSTESWVGNPRVSRCRRVASGASPQTHLALGLTHMSRRSWPPPCRLRN